MKIELIELLDNINDNIDYLISKYPAVNMILNQIDILLLNDASNEMIKRWFESNKSSIEIVNEYIKINSKGKT